MVLGLSVCQLCLVGTKEVSQEAPDAGGLGAPGSRDQRRIQSQVQDLFWVENSGAGLRCVETLDGAGQPNEPLEALDVSTTVVHQLVFSHSSATVEIAGRKSQSCKQRMHQSVKTDVKEVDLKRCIQIQAESTDSPVVLFTLAGCEDDKKHDNKPLHRPVGHLHLLH